MVSKTILLEKKINYLSNKIQREMGNRSTKIVRILKKGNKLKTPKCGDIVSVLYIGKLKDGTVFDSSEFHGNKPFKFKLYGGEVIPGWDMVVRNMCLHQSIIVEIPSHLAYGEKGAGNGKIPPNSDLIFKMTLTAINQ